MSTWQTVRLGDVATIAKGKGLSKDDMTPDGGFPCIHYGELFTKYNEVIQNVTSRTNKNDDVFLSRSGDVLMPTSDVTPRGLATASCIQHDDVVVGGDVLVIRPQPDALNGKFLAYFVSGSKHAILRLTTGTTIFHLYGSDMKRLKLSLPSVSEQQRIVGVLEVWDSYINFLDKRIALKEQLKKGLMQQLLTGKRRLPGFANEWRDVTVGEVARFVNGYTFRSSSYTDNGGYKIITIANVQDGRLNSESCKTIASLPHNLSSEQVLKTGDVLISMTGNVGRTCRVNIENGLLNQRVGKIVALKDKIDERLLYYRLQHRHFLTKMVELAQGGAQDNLSLKDIKGYTFGLPINMEAQGAVADIIEVCELELDHLRQKRTNFNEQRKYLLKSLISGAVRTPEASIREEVLHA